MRTGTEAMQDRDDLDDLFATARVSRPVPSDALMARVLADALAEQPKAAGAMPLVVVPRAGLWSRVAGLFGGVGALAGIGSAAAAGLFIGYVQPAGLSVLDDAVLGTPLETVELMPDVDGLLAGE
jgi:hypothetical protein